MSGLWYIIVPESTTNYTLNPSGEMTGNYAAHSSATVTRDTTYARFGLYSYKIVPGGTNRGINLTLSALPNAAAYVTFYVHGTITGNLQASTDSGSNYNTASVIGGASGGWVRYGVSISSGQANGSTALIIRNSANETWYVDAIQVESKSYCTTYCDGSLQGLYKWNGLFHGSTSTRDGQERRGGRERDLESTYSITVRMPSSGLGMPPVQNNLQDTSIQPGSIYQSYTVLPTALDLAITFPGTSQSNLHARRQDIIDLIKPDGARGAQPFVIGYAGALSATKVYNEFYYADGLPYAGVEKSTEQPNLHIVSVRPYWYEDNWEVSDIDMSDSFTAAYAAARVSGDWGALGSGFNGVVYAIAECKQTGRIWFAGAFSTANGVTVNGICYWNGTTFVAIGGTAGVAGGTATVYALTIAPNGDVWFGGDFTQAGGTTSDGVAYYDLSANAITAITAGTGGDIIYSIAINSSGIAYISGNFVNWDGIAAADYIAQYDGSTWTAVGTPSLSANNYPVRARSMLFDANDVLYIGTAGSAGGNFYKVSGTTWTTLAAVTGGNSDIYGLDINISGEIYIGGSYTTLTPQGGSGQSISYISVYNGTSFSDVGGGTDAGVYSIAVLSSNSFLFGGAFTVSASLDTIGISIWNGYSYSAYDITWAAAVYAICVTSQGDVYIGGSASATAKASGQTQITPSATASVFPVLTIANGNTSGSCTLVWLENQSSEKNLYHNLEIQPGETVTVDFRTGQKKVKSDWRGVIYGEPLDNSDFASWALLPKRPDGTTPNYIACFVTGTLTSVTALMGWTPQHWSADGPA